MQEASRLNQRVRHMKKKPPYYAVIFSSVKSDTDTGYETTAQRMLSLVENQPGFLGVESVANAHGNGITVSYWESLESIAAWKNQAEHRMAQERGKAEWYRSFRLRIAKVEKDYAFNSE